MSSTDAINVEIQDTNTNGIATTIIVNPAMSIGGGLKNLLGKAVNLTVNVTKKVVNLVKIPARYLLGGCKFVMEQMNNLFVRLMNTKAGLKVQEWIIRAVCWMIESKLGNFVALSLLFATVMAGAMIGAYALAFLFLGMGLLLGGGTVIMTIMYYMWFITALALSMAGGWYAGDWFFNFMAKNNAPIFTYGDPVPAWVL